MKFGKIIGSLLIAMVMTTTLTAKTNSGKVIGSLKLVHALKGKTNGYDSTTGSAYYMNLGYKTKSINGFSLKVSGYVVGDTGLTDTDPNEAISKGVFMGKSTKSDHTNILNTTRDLQDLFIDYKCNSFKARAGHFELNTPMTKNATSTVPDLYEGLVVTSKKVLKDTTAVSAYLTKMAYGARAISEWGKISEKKGNAGSIAVNSVGEPAIGSTSLTSPTDMLAIRRGEFTNFGIIGGAEKNIGGLAIAGLINKSFKNTTIQVWDYYAQDVANVIYVDVMKKFKIQKNLKAMVGAQVLTQKIEGLSGTPTLLGAKAGINYKNLNLTVAYNKSNDKQIMNVWGGDPGYTSSKFSRNEYRPDVTAYKVIAKYKPMKKLLLMASHAVYGKSSWVGAQKDAKESNFALKYKITKKLKFAISNVLRTSEFDGIIKSGKVQDKTQNYTSMAVVYKF